MLYLIDRSAHGERSSDFNDVHKMYELSVTCLTSPYFNLDVFIFAQDIQKQGD